jgi:hypothetical protein
MPGKANLSFATLAHALRNDHSHRFIAILRKAPISGIDTDRSTEIALQEHCCKKITDQE